MQIKARDIDAYLQNTNGHHPLILVYGTDQGLVNERVSALVKTMLAGNSDPFAYLTIDSDDIANNPARLADEAGTIALFGGIKIIRVRLTGNRIITKPIKFFTDTPPQDARIIIEGGDLKKTNPIRLLIEKSKTAMAIPCYLDDERSLRRLMEEELRSHNIRLSRESEILLLSLLGENRKISRNELQKLCLYGAGREEVNYNEIEALIGDTSTSITDDTVDLILTGHLKTGLASFQKSLAMGHSSFQTVQGLQRQINHLQLMRNYLDKGQSISDIINSARPPLHFKRRPKITEQLTKWTSPNLSKVRHYALHALAESRLKPSLSNVIIHALLTQVGTVAARRR